jgi:hypothetical protein
MIGASIETTRELWASSLREVKKRIRPLFAQEVLRDTLTAAQLGDAILAAQAFQNDPDLFLRYDEPETLPSSICPICPTSADGGHTAICWISRLRRTMRSG